MSMDKLYREVMDLNEMDDNDSKKDAAKKFFDKLNYMEMPEYFNWADEIFEGVHVKERGDKNALVWADILTDESKTFTYKEFAAHGNQCLNAVRNSGVVAGNNMYMMVPIVPETWFASFACVKGGLVSVPTATTMTTRELEFRFETYPADSIVADEIYTDIIDAALKTKNITPKIKRDGLVLLISLKSPLRQNPLKPNLQTFFSVSLHQAPPDFQSVLVILLFRIR